MIFSLLHFVRDICRVKPLAPQGSARCALVVSFAQAALRPFSKEALSSPALDRRRCLVDQLRKGNRCCEDAAHRIA
jgi:hypothetical protein